MPAAVQVIAHAHTHRVANVNAIGGGCTTRAVTHVDGTHLGAFGRFVDGNKQLAVVVLASGVDTLDGGDVLTLYSYLPCQLCSWLGRQLVVADLDGVFALLHFRYLDAAHLIAIHVIEGDVGILGILVGTECELKRSVHVGSGQTIGIHTCHCRLIVGHGLPLGELVVLHQVQDNILIFDGGTCCHELAGLRVKVGIGGDYKGGLIHTGSDIIQLDAGNSEIAHVGCHHELVLGILEE